MKQLKTLGLTFLAILILGAISATAASALENPEVLSALPATFSSKQGNAANILEVEGSGSKIECTEVDFEGEFTSARLGVASIHSRGCKASKNGLKCDSTGESGGQVLITNIPADIVDVSLPKGEPAPELMLGILFLLPVSIVVECGTLIFFINNNVIGEFYLLGASGTATKAGQVVFKQTAGVQAVKTCDLPKAMCEGQTFGIHANL